MILARIALLALCVGPYGSVAISQMFVQAPPERIASTPAPDAGDKAMTAAVALVQKAIQNLPAWEQDGLARFEQPELAAVKADIQACVDPTAKSDADFLKAVQRLKDDAGTLDALDLVLARERLL